MLPGMNRTVPAALTLAATALLTAACSSASSSTPTAADTASCEQALVTNMRTAYAEGSSATPAAKPPACDGLSDATLEALGKQAIATVTQEVIPSAMASAFGSLPSDAATDAVPTDVPSTGAVYVPTDLPTSG